MVHGHLSETVSRWWWLKPAANSSLSIKERLDLFIKVCHAIQHAHQNETIHRDIKPSNILVTLHDENHRPHQ